jgi:hypothetical protein
MYCRFTLSQFNSVFVLRCHTSASIGRSNPKIAYSHCFSSFLPVFFFVLPYSASFGCSDANQELIHAALQFLSRVIRGQSSGPVRKKFEPPPRNLIL